MKTEKERLHFSARVAGIDFDEAEVKVMALLLAQRDRFEQAICIDTGWTPSDIAGWRDGDFDYSDNHYWLRGAWKGWKLRERLSGNDPFVGFMLESANEGELAAYEYGCTGMMGALEDVLNSMERGGGVSVQPWEGLKARVYALKEKAAMYDWLVAQRNLLLESATGFWTRPDGSRFSPSHRLCAGETQFAPQETLEATINCARAVQNARTA